MFILLCSHCLQGQHLTEHGCEDAKLRIIEEDIIEEDDLSIFLNIYCDNCGHEIDVPTEKIPDHELL